MQTGMTRGIPQCALIEGSPPKEGRYPTIYEGEICHRSPYTFRYSDERYAITGIACLPVSEEMQSPEAQVVEGGLNESYVIIRLTPQEDYEYACHITLTGRERQPHCRQR